MISILENPKTSSELTELLAVSNTPYFLFRKFRENQEVQFLGEEETTEHIVSKIRDVEKSLQGVENNAIFYGYLIALSYKADVASRAFLEDLLIRYPNSRWFRQIVSFIVRTQADLIVQSFQVPSRPTVTEQIESDSMANDSEINVWKEP